MNTKTLKALKGSIKKWEKIVAGKGEDKGPNNCPLCLVFIDATCEKCPVYKKTNASYCDRTPYHSWEVHQSQIHPERHENRIYCPACKRLAKNEIDFLKSLLPVSTKAMKKGEAS